MVSIVKTAVLVAALSATIVAPAAASASVSHLLTTDQVDALRSEMARYQVPVDQQESLIADLDLGRRTWDSDSGKTPASRTIDKTATSENTVFRYADGSVLAGGIEKAPAAKPGMQPRAIDGCHADGTKRLNCRVTWTGLSWSGGFSADWDERPFGTILNAYNPTYGGAGSLNNRYLGITRKYGSRGAPAEAVLSFDQSAPIFTRSCFVKVDVEGTPAISAGGCD